MSRQRTAKRLPNKVIRLKYSSCFEKIIPLPAPSRPRHMDRHRILMDILALIDSNPMNNMDIGDIIAKHLEGLDIDGQRPVRMTIRVILQDLKREGEVEYSDANISNLTTTMQGSFVSSSLLVRSTWKRQKEIQQAAQQSLPTFQIGGDFKGNINTGKIEGTLIQNDLRGDFPAQKPAIHPNIAAIPPPKKSIIYNIWSWITTNPMFVTIIGGIIALLIGTIILRHYKII